MKPLYRVHIRYRSGLDRYDETVTAIESDPELRTIRYTKVDGITVEYPCEALLFWASAPIRYEHGQVDARLTVPPSPVYEPLRRPPELDWPVDVDF